MTSGQSLLSERNKYGSPCKSFFSVSSVLLVGSAFDLITFIIVCDQDSAYCSYF